MYLLSWSDKYLIVSIKQKLNKLINLGNLWILKLNLVRAYKSKYKLIIICDKLSFS